MPHFPTRVLRLVGGWDAFNVTEDADLGYRLARFGFGSRMIRSHTAEEAPERLWTWLRQRTRWLKGWMQTYIVHSRRPLEQLRDLGLWRWFAFHAHLGGGILSSLLYPVCLGLLSAQISVEGPWRAFDLTSHDTLRCLASLVLFFGLGTPVLHAAICALRRRRWDLVLHIPLMPVYWLLISLAAYRALYQIAIRPFDWERPNMECL